MVRRMANPRKVRCNRSPPGFLGEIVHGTEVEYFFAPEKCPFYLNLINLLPDLRSHSQIGEAV